MAIPSVETYLRVNIDSYLKQLLSSSKLIKTKILTEFDDDIVTSFTKTFCTDLKGDKLEIPVGFTYNNDKPQGHAAILIQEKAGEEHNNSLGEIVGSGKNNSKELVTEYSVLKYDENSSRAYYEVSQEVQEVNSLSALSAQEFDIEGKRLYFSSPGAIYASKLGNSNADEITYFPKRDMTNRKTVKSNLAGFDATEEFTVDILSSNIDTLRCLTAIVKVILLTMRIRTQEEHYEYRLGKMHWESVDMLSEANGPFNSTTGNQIFTKRVNVQVDDTYSIDSVPEYLIDNFKYIEDKGAE